MKRTSMHIYLRPFLSFVLFLAVYLFTIKLSIAQEVSTVPAPIEFVAVAMSDSEIQLSLSLIHI